MPRFKQQITADRGAILHGNYGGEFLLKNWPYQSASLSSSGRAVVWDDTSRLWFSLGTDSTNTFVYTSANGLTWVSLLAGISNFVPSVMGATKVPNQNFIFAGGDPAGSSASKIYYTTDAGVSWNVPSGGVGAADTEAINATAYGPTVGYLAMGSASGHIYRSATGTSGWSLVFTAGGSPSVMFRGLVVGYNLSPIVAIACFQGSTTYYSTTNGTSWTSRTFPANASSVTYSASLKKFFMVAGTGELYVSVSGVGGWTLVSNNASLSVIRAFGSLLVGAGESNGAFSTSGVVYSPDQGSTWYPALSTNNIGASLAVAQQHTLQYGTSTEPIIEPHQALYVTGAPTATYYASLKGQ